MNLAWVTHSCLAYRTKSKILKYKDNVFRHVGKDSNERTNKIKKTGALLHPSIDMMWGSDDWRYKKVYLVIQ